MHDSYGAYEFKPLGLHLQSPRKLKTTQREIENSTTDSRLSCIPS